MSISMTDSVIPYSDKFQLAEQVTAEGKAYIKAPVGVIGEWKHPEYGDLKFTQADFDDITRNWSNNETGYEPPMTLGHIVDKTVQEGAPSMAFLEKLEQVGDVLYGIYDPVDKTALEDVKAGKFRYSSPELVRNSSSKKTGEKIGTLLRGLALTNRPFLTGLPRVEVGFETLSENPGETIQRFAIPVQPEVITSDMSTNESPAKIEAPAAPVIEEKQEALSDPAIQAVLKSLTEQVEVLRNELTSTREQLSDATKQLDERSLSEKLTTISALNLSEDVKDQYKGIVTSGKLSDEAQADLMTLLQTLSEKNKEIVTSQSGSTDEETTAVASEPINPYKDIIERNVALAEKQVQAHL